MNEMPKMLSKNFKEKNFVALELTLNGQKEAVDTTPVERTKKMTNVSNAENEVTLLAIAEDVVAGVAVVQAEDAEAEVVAEVEVGDMVVIEVALRGEEVMIEMVVEVVVAVEAAVEVVLPEEKQIVAVVREVIVDLPAQVERMISIRAK